MKSLLLKHKPEELSAEEWKKNWANLQFSLDPLCKAIEEAKEASSRVKEDDFSIPNHYALLAHQTGKREAFDFILDLIKSS